MKDLVYQENRGNAGKLAVYLLEGEKCDALLFFFHGGGLEEGDKTDQKGIYGELSSRGIAVVSANYRMYPAAKYPQYIEDAAKAVAWGLTHIREWIDGYIFDAGQPTVHYNILRERGIDPKSVRVDGAAPIYYLEGEQVRAKKQFFLIMVSDNDIPGRREQNELMIQTMKTHQYEDFQIYQNGVESIDAGFALNYQFRYFGVIPYICIDVNFFITNLCFIARVLSSFGVYNRS